MIYPIIHEKVNNKNREKSNNIKLNTLRFILFKLSDDNNITTFL